MLSMLTKRFYIYSNGGVFFIPLNFDIKEPGFFSLIDVNTLDNFKFVAERVASKLEIEVYIIGSRQ